MLEDRLAKQKQKDRMASLCFRSKDLSLCISGRTLFPRKIVLIAISRSLMMYRTKMLWMDNFKGVKMCERIVQTSLLM